MRWTMAVMVLALAGCEPEGATKLDDTGEPETWSCPTASRYAWVGTECEGVFGPSPQPVYLPRAGGGGCGWSAPDYGDWRIEMESPAPGGTVRVQRGAKHVSRGTWDLLPESDATPEMVILRLPPSMDGQARVPWTCERGDGIALLVASPMRF